MQCVCALLLTLLMGFIYEGRSYNGHYLGLERNVCDEEAAAACEYELLKCKIFTGNFLLPCICTRLLTYCSRTCW